MTGVMESIVNLIQDESSVSTSISCLWTTALIFSHLRPQSFNSNGFFFLLTVYRVSVISRFQTAEQSLRYHKRIGQQCDSNRNRHKVHKAFCVG